MLIPNMVVTVTIVYLSFSDTQSATTRGKNPIFMDHILFIHASIEYRGGTQLSFWYECVKGLK